LKKQPCKDVEHAIDITASISTIEDGGQVLTSNSPVADYWGFRPELKDSVESAVKAAVKNVVQKAVLPRDTNRHEASKTYRRLIAESLAEAARTADEYLTRSSIWNSSASISSLVPSLSIQDCMEIGPLDAKTQTDIADSEVQETVLDHTRDTRDTSFGRHRPVDITGVDKSDPGLPKQANGVKSLSPSIESVHEIVPELHRNSSATIARSSEGKLNPTRSLPFSKRL
jgi:hypothetical protein